MIKDKTIAILGAGNMGSALIGGIIKKKLVLPDSICACDLSKERLEHLAQTYKIKTTCDNKQAIGDADLIILAVKPQQLPDLLTEIKPLLGKDKLLISIAAGVTIRKLQLYLSGVDIRIIRIMPNMPAFVGAAMSALCKSDNANSDDLKLAEEIFESIGETVIVKENLMDAVTGLSGSGPAYIMVIIEALADAGVKLGLPRDISLKLSLQTVLGSALLLKEKGLHPAQLKDMVASPGGATIAGLFELECGGLRATLIKAVEAAARRSKELGELE